MSHHRYEPRGPQAIRPEAMFWMFPDVDESENDELDTATIVTIRGPITQHGYWWDSYESIRRRVDDACKKAAPVVVLRIDSPGGEVAGLFDAARAIREVCTAAGKRLLVHVEGQCSSAAYALACTADRIVASTTAEVGSIGVIAARFDETARDAKDGLRVALITSGSRKADWNPHSPITDDELSLHQIEVDAIAAEFFELVSTYRKGLAPAAVEALQAASFRGSAAVKAGLVDELGSFEHLLASLGAGAATGETMSKAEEAREALRSIAEDEECSDEERARARKALAALDDEPAEDGDGDGEDKPAEDEPADDAEGEEDEKEASAAAGTVSAATAGAIAAHGVGVEKRLVALERRHEAEERQRLIDAHGGVTKGLAKLLASKPLAEVRSILAELPKPKRPKLGDAAATATVAGTRGAGQDKASQLPPAEARAMRMAMGLEQQKFGVVTRGNVQILGAPEGEEVR